MREEEEQRDGVVYTDDKSCSERFPVLCEVPCEMGTYSTVLCSSDFDFALNVGKKVIGRLFLLQPTFATPATGRSWKAVRGHHRLVVVRAWSKSEPTPGIYQCLPYEQCRYALCLTSD